jgi:mRNA interferase RelE/StbE
LAWTVEINGFAEKQLRKLDHPSQKCLLDWLWDRIDGCKKPRHFGEPLRGDLNGLWRYRVENYRIICEIHDEKLVVLALAIGHRWKVYSHRKEMADS